MSLVKVYVNRPNRCQYWNAQKVIVCLQIKNQRTRFVYLVAWILLNDNDLVGSTLLE